MCCGRGPSGKGKGSKVKKLIKLAKSRKAKKVSKKKKYYYKKKARRG